MEPTIDKEGHKHYRMKMDTGYLNSKGNDANVRKNEIDLSKIPSFSFIVPAGRNMTKVKVSIPGFKNFGLKRISITEVETDEIVFEGNGFTIFGMTRCRISRQGSRRIKEGKKYKITISR